MTGNVGWAEILTNFKLLTSGMLYYLGLKTKEGTRRILDKYTKKNG